MPPPVLVFNGIDLLMVVVLGLAVYIRRGDGIVAELFKLFGIFCTIFITLHYYSRFAEFLEVQFFSKKVDADFFSFCLLFVLVFVTFALISNGWSLILKIKSFDIVDLWGNRILSLVRGYFICSMIFLGLILAGNESYVTQARKSLSSPVISGAAVELYRMTYSGLIKSFFPGEKINEKVFELIGKSSVKAKNKLQ